MKEKTKYQEKCRLLKDDEVIVTKGKAKGQTGKVQSVDRKKGKIFIAGINTVRRHAKPSMANPNGGIIDKIMPIPICNVALVDPKTKKATKISYKKEGDKKIRVTKASKSTLS